MIEDTAENGFRDLMEDAVENAVIYGIGCDSGGVIPSQGSILLRF